MENITLTKRNIAAVQEFLFGKPVVLKTNIDHEKWYDYCLKVVEYGIRLPGGGKAMIGDTIVKNPAFSIEKKESSEYLNKMAREFGLIPIGIPKIEIRYI